MGVDSRTLSESHPLLSKTQNDESAVSPVRRKVILALCITIAYLGCLDLTLVATCLQPIASELKQSNAASWIATGYLWSTTTFTPLYGRLSDHVGRRNALLQAIFLFATGTTLCGLSVNVETLALSRFLAGIGGGGQMAVGTVLISDLFPLRERAFYQGLLQIGVAAGMGSGGLIGGLITSKLGWRAAFLLQVPFSITCLVIAALVVPQRKRDTSYRDIDFGGSLSLLVSIGSLLIGLSFVVEQDLPITYPPFVVSITSFVIFLFIFIYVELRLASHPIMPIELILNPTLFCVGLICGLIAVVNFTFLYFLPVFFELVMGKSAAESGLHLAPNALAMCIGSPVVGLILKCTGRHKWTTTICCLGPLLSMLLLSTFTQKTSAALQWFSVLPMGFGFSGLLTSALIAAQRAGRQDQIGSITSFVFLFRSLGQVFGVAISSAIFQSALSVQLRKVFDSEAIIRQLRHSAETLFDLPASEQRLARLAFQSSLRFVFYFAAAAALIVLLTSLPIPNTRLDEDPAVRAKRDDQQ